MQLHVTVHSGLEFLITPELRAQHKDFLASIRRELEIPNPERIQAERYGRYAGHIDPVIRCYEWQPKTGWLVLPRGYRQRLAALATRAGVQLVWDDRTTWNDGPPIQVPASRICLREYQEKAVQALLNAEEGLLIAPPGAGKTEMALELLARLGQPALWITHKIDLAEQVLARAEQRLELYDGALGMIGGGRSEMGEWLTVGTVQTLAKRDLSKWAHTWSVIVVDECHHMPANLFKTVVSQLPARRRYGLTGTLKRRDGLHVITEIYLGPVVHRVERHEVEAEGGTVIPILKVVSTGIRSQTWDQYEEELARWKRRCEELALQGRSHEAPPQPIVPWQKIQTELLANPERNAFIAHWLARWAPGHSNLVLTTRIEHGETLLQLVVERAPRLRCALLHHRMSRTEREAILSSLREGRTDVLFAVDIPKEGLDVPRLDRLWFVAGGRDDILVQQAVGRIQRPHPAKQDAMVIDFVDWDVGIMAAHHRIRRRIYRRLGMLAPIKQTALATA